MRIAVTQSIPESALALLRDHEVVIAASGRAPTREELHAAARDADAIVSLLSDAIDAALLERAARLKVVSNVAVGFDNIDVAAATRLGVLVTNTPGVLEETTADLAIALMLAAARRVAEADRYVRAGNFRRFEPMLMVGRDLHHKTLGIVGLGGIGRAVARRAALGFGMSILYAGPRPKPDIERELGARHLELDELLRESDFVSLHLPLSAGSRHLIDARRLALLKPTAVLVNTARGPIVDEAALAQALRERRLFAAGLDVYEHEPAVLPDLLALDNVVLTPHIGSASTETRTRIAELAATNALDVLRGERPRALVNAEVWDSAARLGRAAQR